MRGRRHSVWVIGLMLVPLAFVGCGGGGGGDGGGGGGSSIPRTAGYEITLTGTTYSGSTSFLQPGTTFTPVANFQLTGVVVVLPTRDASGVNFNNGVNPRDVGLFVGNPPAIPQAGATWVATNTAVFTAAGLGNIDQALANIDVATVTLDSSARTISVEMDGNFGGSDVARQARLNTFNTRSGSLVNVYQVLLGTLDLQFAEDGRTLSGSMDLFGNGFIQPATARVRATIAGTLAG